MSTPLDERLAGELDERKAEGLLRTLRHSSGLIDFCSNDYLGVVRDNLLASTASCGSGSSGSRLISGHSPQFEQAEQLLAETYRAESALMFNSGYDANLGLLSALPKRSDTILYDELCHASMRDGIRLSHARSFSFRHNDLDDLQKKAHQARGQLFLAVESLYSMDGDRAPLRDLVSVSEAHNAALVVDEAHSGGVLGPQGKGLVVEDGLEARVFARVHTFGKALGCHGAVVLGSTRLREYLMNFARSFIYTTALPPTSVAHVIAAHEKFPQWEDRRLMLRQNVALFSRLMGESRVITQGGWHIRCVQVPDNERAREASRTLAELGLDVRAILSPTVPAGTERLRLCLHAFNSVQDIELLVSGLRGFVNA